MPDRGDCGIERLLAPSGDDNRRAFFRKTLRDRETDSAAAAGYDGDLSLKSLGHNFHSIFVSDVRT
ncbi:hypothetical protein EP7_005579 (plasmid) [Isosphaeraceae bacterium EP7]